MNRLQLTAEQHRRWVANYFGNKVEEFGYHLATIVDACDESSRLFANGQPIPKENSEAVIFSFSSFSNVIQTLKDTARTVTGVQLSWSRIEQLRHGTFLHEARNAATHDGNPVVSAWVDGRYFVPMKILRLDQHGHLVEISPPRQDVRTLCLEFAVDYCGLLREVLRDNVDTPQLRGAVFNLSELDEAVAESTVLPEFAKELFAEKREEIGTQLDGIRHDPIAHAIGRLDAVIRYCELSNPERPSDQLEQHRGRLDQQH